MNKRILIPTDFSPNAYNAIKYAMALFATERCEFFILNSYYLSGYSKDNLLSPEPTEEEREQVKGNSERGMKQLKAQMRPFEAESQHSFTYLNEFGPFYDTLNRVVESKDVALVIMGTRGHSDSKNVILGSNAVNVMEKIRYCPVMAIPSHLTYSAPNEIVFPTSFLNTYKEKELDVMLLLAKLTNAPIRVLHVQKDRTLTDAQLKIKAQLDAILAPVPYTYHTLYDMDVNDGVRSFVQSRESEMIAFVNKKHNFFGGIFSNPMVRELGKTANVPILAMHDV